MKKERSRNALPETPDDWMLTNIMLMPAYPGPNNYALSCGVFNSYIGSETCRAVGIPKAWELSLDEAKAYGAKLDAWLQKQERAKR